MAKSAGGAGSIRKKTVTRDGKTYTYWEGRVTVGYDPGTGKQIRRSFSGKTQKEVRAKIQQAAVELANGTYQEPTRLTVGAWLEEWMESFVKPTVKPLTVSSYAAAIKNHITPSMGSVKLQALRGTHVQKLYNTMWDSGLSAKTIKNVSAILHKAFSVAVKQGLMATNPCDAADVPKGKAREIVPLTDAQIPLFLEAIQGDPYCNAFALCLLAGLREGECLGLSWEQVDFDNGRITISRQLQKEKRKGGQYYIADSTKSGKPRVIEPPPIAFQYLRAEKKKQIENRLHMGEHWDNPFDLVFTEESGRYIIFQTFHTHFKKIAASIGCPDARPHDLRHTCATVAISSGADIKSVQSLLGHATASFTLNVYTHTSDKMKADTAARMQSYYDSMKKQG